MTAGIGDVALERRKPIQDISELSEDDLKSVEWIQNNLGYFIAYENLYDTWIDKGADFDVSDVLIVPCVGLKELDFAFGEILVEDETEDVVLVFACIDL